MGPLLNEGRLTEHRNGRTGFIALYLALRRLGFSPLVNVTGFFVGALIVNGWLRVPVNLLLVSVDLWRMMGGPVDHRADTGVLHSGVFNAAQFERLIGFSSNGTTLSVDDLARLIAADYAREPSTVGRLMACAEFAALLRVFGEDPSAPGELGLHLPISSLVSLYRDNELPKGWRAGRRTGMLTLLLLVRRLRGGAPSARTEAAAASS